MKLTYLLRTLALLASAIALDSGMGCFLGCGVGPAPDYTGVNDAGVVEIQTTAVGSTSELVLPVKDSADVDETLLSASFTGPGAAAFQVLSTFPISIPAGTQVTLSLKFSPTAVGSATATLNLQTEDMGISPIAVEGNGE